MVEVARELVLWPSWVRSDLATPFHFWPSSSNIAKYIGERGKEGESALDSATATAAVWKEESGRAGGRAGAGGERRTEEGRPTMYYERERAIERLLRAYYTEWE